MSIPSINFFDKDAPEKFAQSIKDVGFAVVENHLLEQLVLNEAYKAWGDFFMSAQKNKYQFNQEVLSGFTPQSRSEIAKGYKIKDVKEFYTFHPLMRCPSSLRVLTYGVFHTATAMATLLLQWLEQNPPHKALQHLALTDMVKNSVRTLLRIIHYPPLTGVESTDAMRAAAHEDINFLAIHPAATSAGLQLLHKNGSWVTVPPDPGLMIISVGDMLAECSQGFYQSTTHRVINPVSDIANVSRFSMCLYLHPRDDVRLSARYTARDYLTERCREIGLITNH